MILDDAISAHADWKTKFRTAINRQETMDDAAIAKDNGCKLGAWLYSEGKAKHGNTKEFASLVAKHKDFHSAAGSVARLINAKKFPEAEKAIGSGTTYTDVSNAVCAAIIALKKVA